MVREVHPKRRDLDALDEHSIAVGWSDSLREVAIVFHATEEDCWYITMPPDKARQLAQELTDAALQAERQ